VSGEFIVLAGLQFGQELLDRSLNAGEFVEQGGSMHYREISRSAWRRQD
jgi:hypothetical protein